MALHAYDTLVSHFRLLLCCTLVFFVKSPFKLFELGFVGWCEGIGLVDYFLSDTLRSLPFGCISDSVEMELVPRMLIGQSCKCYHL